MGCHIRRIHKAACAMALITGMAAFSMAQSAAQTITESGSTLMYAWIAHH